MTARRPEIPLLLFSLLSMAPSAMAGSSATATTTISANIVPAASFTARDSVVLIPRGPGQGGGNESVSNQASSATGLTLDTIGTARFSINSSNNVIYDLSIPASVDARSNAANMTTRIDEFRHVDHPYRNIEEYQLRLNGAVDRIDRAGDGTFRGLLDITVNYN